jgi:hypothetical protein
MEAMKIVLHPVDEQPKSKENDLIVDLNPEEIVALKEAKVGMTIKLNAVIDKGYNGSNNPVVQDCSYEASLFELDEFTDPKIIKPMELPKKLSHGTKITIEVTKQK